jgi:hypothetical protein
MAARQKPIPNSQPERATPSSRASDGPGRAGGGRPVRLEAARLPLPTAAGSDRPPPSTRPLEPTDISNSPHAPSSRHPLPSIP